MFGKTEVDDVQGLRSTYEGAGGPVSRDARGQIAGEFIAEGGGGDPMLKLLVMSPRASHLLRENISAPAPTTEMCT